MSSRQEVGLLEPEPIDAPQLNRNAARLDFRQVRHSFRQGSAVVPALDAVDLEVPAGQFVAIVGPSGCGKTTLLGMAAGMIRPRSGQVLFDGAELSETSTEVAYMLARDALLPWRTSVENVELALQVRGVNKKERRERSLDWLARLGLRDYADSYVGKLSHGMRQRVAIARTLVQDPRCILMDEPFAALDAQTRIRVQSQFLELWEQNRPTVLFVTHDLSEAVLLADRVVLMSGRPGQFIEDVTVSLARPRNVDQDRRSEAFRGHHDLLWDRLKSQFEESL